jgi:hypothetical protein
VTVSVAIQARLHGGNVAAADACTAAVAAAEVKGAWLSAAAGVEAGHLMSVTEVSERLAELELTLGEVSSLDASASGGPVLVSGWAPARPPVASRWTPRRQCRPTLGRSSCSRCESAPSGPGCLACTGRSQARSPHSGSVTRLCSRTLPTLLLLEAQDQAAGGREGAGSPGGQPADLAPHRAEIDQATGMLTEQLGTGIAEALLRLRAYAYAHDRRLADVPSDIVARRLRLTATADLAGHGET